jgi:hypothetical protein
MNVTMCTNNHYFDSDMYDVCPICGAGVKANNFSDSGKKSSGSPKFGGLFHKKKNTEERAAEPVSRGNPVSMPESFSQSGKKMPVYSNQVSGTTGGGGLQPIGGQPNSEKTIDFWNVNKSSREDKEPAVNTAVNSVPEPSVSANASEKDSGESDKSESAAAEPEQSRPSLLDAVKKVSANTDEKTISYFSAANKKMLSSDTPKGPVDPVVGWLVCVSGPHFGDSFSIVSGKNSIGRSTENKIVISGDNTVSRSKHALIIYEPKKRNFYLQPGDGSGLTYLNNDDVFETKIISAKDIIEIGSSKFMFVPLCDESFSWSDYEENEQ